jgi:hypothetical protein
VHEGGSRKTEEDEVKSEADNDVELVDGRGEEEEWSSRRTARFKYLRHRPGDASVTCSRIEDGKSNMGRAGAD